MKLAESGLQTIDTPDVILIAECDVWGLAGDQQAVERLLWTEALVKRGEKLDPAAMCLDPAIKNAEGAICGAVVVNQHASWLQALPLKAFQLLLEIRRSIPGGEQHFNILRHQSCKPHLRK